MQVQLPTVSYILTFFSDIKNLTDNLAAFSNVLLLVKSKTNVKNESEIGTTDFKKAIEEGKISQEELAALQKICNDIRFWSTQSYIKFQGLKKKIPDIESESKNLTKLYRTIQSSICPQYETVEEYVILCNQLFSTTALGDMLVKNKEYYEQLSEMNEVINSE